MTRARARIPTTDGYKSDAERACVPGLRAEIKRLIAELDKYNGVKVG